MPEPHVRDAAAGAFAASHDHNFLGAHHDQHERRARLVVGLSLVVMALELAGGFGFHSVALIADGLHMSTHAGAMLAAAAAYALARRRLGDPRFSFGTGKFGDLAAFASGVGLLVMAVFIAIEGVERLLHPEPVAFLEAAGVAGLGLATSLVSAIALRHAHGDAEHGHVHAHDLNLWAAYLHMITDVITSLLTVLALVAGQALGWSWLDALVGLVGAAVTASFAVGLLRRAAAVLLDMTPGDELTAAVRARLEVGGDRVDDLHLWRVGPGRLALIAQISTDAPQPIAVYRGRVAEIPQLAHATFEIEAASAREPAKAP